MRVPNSTHESRSWRIQEIAPDFTVEDVWALPVHGRADEFQSLLDVMGSLDPAHSGSFATRTLWRVRDCLGRAFGLGRIAAANDPDGDHGDVELSIPGTTETSLIARLPQDLRDTAPSDAGPVPFVPVYRTDDEYAAEISNRTVHAVMHLAWVGQDDGSYRGQMTVYVKPRGQLGKGYMAFIKPFRHWLVYPELMRLIERAWNARGVQ